MAYFEENPLTLVHDAMWDMVEAHPHVNDIVKVKNRIKYNDASDRSPKKNLVQAADVPELVLLSDGGNPNLQNTSSTSRLTRRFAWMVSTGDMRANHYLYQVEWMIFVAMHNWKQVLTALRYNENQFVTKASIVNVTEGISVSAQNRNLQGWSSLWRCEIEMHFKLSDIKAELS